MDTNPNNIVIFSGHVYMAPRLEEYDDYPFKVLSFLFNIHRLSGQEEGESILYDVARLKIENPEIIEKARALEPGIMIQAHCHYEYNPHRKRKEASAFVVDDFTYMGGVAHIRTTQKLQEVLANGVLAGHDKKGFLSKVIEILRFRG